VDGQPIDAETTPTTGNPTPEITGRVELGVPVIDLAIADGEVIRFQAEVSNRGRFRATAPQELPDGQYSLYINDLLIGAFTVEAGAETGEQREPGPLLDIARVVPYPADFGEQIAGIGFLDGRFYTLEEEAARTAAAGDDASSRDVRDVERRLAEAGWLQRYENRLAVPNPDDPDTFSLQVSSFVVEYASGADARSAFAALTADDQAVEAPAVGDESVLTLLSGVTPDTGVDYQAARLVFRVGPMLGMIVYADLLNQEPDLALIDAVAQNVAARGQQIAERQTVPLGSMTLRLDPSAATGRLVRRDLYNVRAGTLTALYAEDDATRQERVALFTGTTDAFFSTTNGAFLIGEAGQRRRDREATPDAPAQPTPTSVISIEGQPAPEPEAATPTPADAGDEEQPSAQVFLTSALYEFPTDADADAWLSARRDQLAAESGAGGLTEITDAPALGEASVTFATRRGLGAGEETAGGFRIYSRVGPIVAELEISSLPDMTLDGAASLMEAQIACIEAQGCPGPAAVPGALAVAEPGREVAAAEGGEPTAAPVIIIEGEETGSDPTREPRERRRNRDRQDEATQEAAG
jgi:hypothetical protein